MNEEYKENTARGVLALMDLWLQAKIKKADERAQGDSLGEFGYDAPHFLYREVKDTLEGMIRDAGLDPDEILIRGAVLSEIIEP